VVHDWYDCNVQIAMNGPDQFAPRGAVASLLVRLDARGTAPLHEQIFREVKAVLTVEQRAKGEAQLAERVKRLDEQKARLERMRR
jgi:hypothetical protein